ncbi:hypothetical protein A9K65_021515 [Mesorhizobium sp. WSM1497]|nr:hypothetical protein A9K65_021515 [Mesorhizobium sp. WSM1497]
MIVEVGYQARPRSDVLNQDDIRIVIVDRSFHRLDQLRVGGASTNDIEQVVVLSSFAQIVPTE